MALSRGNNPNPADLQKKKAAESGAEVTTQDPAAKPASAKAKAEAEVDTRVMLLAVKKRIRDPYADIMYDLNTPKPVGNKDWCRVQVAAGVLKAYVPPTRTEEG